ncbi:MAG TPA: alpha-amylase family glycosyl hydrolase [Candidatus Atribacteria bacterium]|nr:alpha-amylase family glycosyl hydrolase [Candidatus Atribacteria bacterium]
MRIEKTGSKLKLVSDSLICTFDLGTGTLESIEKGSYKLPLKGITVDVGCDGDYILDSLVFDSMLDKRTWELPLIAPKQGRSAAVFTGFEEGADRLIASYTLGPLDLRLVYSFAAGTLKVHAELVNRTEKELWLNGLAFITGLESDAVFDFPTNVPCGEFDTRALEPYKPVITGLVNSCVHSVIGTGHLNLAFIDPIEKWSCGVWTTGTITEYAYVPNLEVMAKPGEPIVCGDLYFQPVEEENPYIKIRELYEDLGYKAADDGIREGIMYSCHPHGTMDSNFPLRFKMNEYAEYLPKLKDMGIDHVWLLPIFDHPDGNCYHSSDQAIIDKRYGTDEDVRYFVDRAHELGMTVLFDYVPHGPAKHQPLAVNNPDWCSRKQDGSLQIEWECVSFDYNNPEYQEYTVNLAYDHVKRFGVDGARIDCAMGGLSNWRPYGDNRPSANGVKAGVSISKAVRDGFIKGGKKPFNLPENFHPIPNYYPYTDVFYGMNLYRVLCELDRLIHDHPAEYVKKLTSWLEKEYLSTPVGYTKMRFLGNHDTVSWVWQSARATDYYGVETAKALWAVITLIDGMPMIYQGDEDPAIYLKEGPVLRDFFKKLFADRKEYIGDSKEIEYIYTDTPVMAFIRPVEGGKRLVLVNLSKESCTFDADRHNIGRLKLLTGKVTLEASMISVEPYSYAIFDLA